MSKLETLVGHNTMVRRRTILKAGIALGASQVVGAPYIVRALGEEPVKIGMVDPLTPLDLRPFDPSRRTGMRLRGAVVR